MSDLDKIKKTLKQNKQNLRREFKVKMLGIFGSYVRGEQNKNSDVEYAGGFFSNAWFV